MLDRNDSKRQRGTKPVDYQIDGQNSAKDSRDSRSRGKGNRKVAPGMRIDRFFTRSGDDGFAGVEWDLRTASIIGEGGKIVFEQRDVEVPRSWSQTATNVVVQKYFRGHLGTPGREQSVRQLITRVAETITAWGMKDGYFADQESADVYRAELCHLLVDQKMAFNSPVWFNVGIEPEPQCSACFINSVEDTMESILGLAKTEGMLFKYGSGTGTNLSPLRSSKEYLVGGGTASGPVSFMKGFDAFAGVIKSGGKTRRAAKMVILNVDHPDIQDFIQCKSKEECKAWALIDSGYDGSFDGEAYKSVFFQNSNNSVRVTDEFMEAVQKDREWVTKAVRDGVPVETMKARDLWRSIAQATWDCGDPGLQFDTTINSWHTCSATDRINASNPCSEYMFLDNSACNLASLNLRKYLRLDGTFDTESFKQSVELTVLAQEIIVGNAKYPTKAIEENSLRFRPLGLGYANLGSLLMTLGLPYDSAPARAWCGAITALMTGWAYRTSSAISRDVTGPFAGYKENEQPFIGVMKKHRYHTERIESQFVHGDLMSAARGAWDDAITLGGEFGYRNAQATVLAPTGTIGFMMDCDTTGIEPDIALIKYKRLVGGGMIKIVNNTTEEALSHLGYDEDQRKAIIDYVDREETIEGAPGLSDDHLPVFDCAFRAANGTRSIHYMGHIRMMAAAQPFISGAISKTVNQPADATVEEIENAYMEAWKAGLKAIAIYREGCKRTQPVSTSKTDPGATLREKVATAAVSTRHKLPDERRSLTHKFAVGGHEGYIHVGLYDNGEPGEIFIRMAKEGSTISGLMDSFATAVSLSLQHGVPLRLLVDKFSRMRFEPSGFTGNPAIPRATSVMDYLFRWLGSKFIREEGEVEDGKPEAAPVETTAMVVVDHTKSAPRLIPVKTYGYVPRSDSPMCPECGSIMVPNGSCHKCTNCGTTSGCS